MFLIVLGAGLVSRLDGRRGRCWLSSLVTRGQEYPATTAARPVSAEARARPAPTLRARRVPAPQGLAGRVDAPLLANFLQELALLGAEVAPRLR